LQKLTQNPLIPLNANVPSNNALLGLIPYRPDGEKFSVTVGAWNAKCLSASQTSFVQDYDYRLFFRSQMVAIFALKSARNHYVLVGDKSAGLSKIPGKIIQLIRNETVLSSPS
jgi:hypothetical protein